MSDLSRRAFLAGTSLVVVAKSSLAIPSVAWSAPKTGVAAPVFTATDTGGKAVSLGDQHGKIVVLEWTNHDCPYVRKHYDTGNMQALQKEATGHGVVWLTIISSAPGTQGYVNPREADELTTTRKAAPTAVLLDPTGVVGKMYGATNTPHMYVIDKAGTLMYAGAIDDRPRRPGSRPRDGTGRRRPRRGHADRRGQLRQRAWRGSRACDHRRARPDQARRARRGPGVRFGALRPGVRARLQGRAGPRHRSDHGYASGESRRDER